MAWDEYVKCKEEIEAIYKKYDTDNSHSLDRFFLFLFLFFLFFFFFPLFLEKSWCNFLFLLFMICKRYDAFGGIHLIAYILMYVYMIHA